MTERYSRQQRFTPIGEDGQERIRLSHVLLIGCGALGTHLAELLVRAGVGSLSIVDRDVVEHSNLQRQIMFTEHDAREGLPKAVAAQRRLSEINSEVDVRALCEDFTHHNASEHSQSADVILDGTDNFETRMLINDLSVKLGKPWIYAACIGSTSMVMPIVPGTTGCFACLLEEMPATGGDTCETAGIIMPAVMIASAIAGAEALKLLSGNTDALSAKLHVHDCWSGTHQAINTSRARADCDVCGRGQLAYLSGRNAQQAVSLCGRNTVQITPPTKLGIPLEAVAERLKGFAQDIDSKSFLLRARVGEHDVSLFPDGRALISGTADIAKARNLYAKLIGS